MIFTAKAEVSSSFTVFNSQIIRRHTVPSYDVVHEDLSLLGLSEPKGYWHGSLDASGGGSGDTLVKIIFVLLRLGRNHLLFEYWHLKFLFDIISGRV